MFDEFWESGLEDFKVGFGKIEASLAGFLGDAGGVDDEVGAF